MKKLLFIPLFFLTLLVGCKNTPDVPEQFDLNKINFDYKVYEGCEEYKGLELFKKVSYDKEHYFFYIENCTKGGIKVLYGDEVLGTMDDYYELRTWGNMENDKTKLVDKYFNLELNVEEPETFKDYTYEFEKLGNKIYFIILPTIRPCHDDYYNFPYEKFIESDEYPLYYSDDEKDIHIGFTFKDNLLKPNCVNGVYNFTDLTNKYNVRYIWLVYLGWMDLSMLPLTKQEQKIIDDYKNLTNLRLDDDYSIYKAFKKSEPESILLYAIMVDENKVYRYMDYLSGINVRLSGKDIIKLGIEPSKKFAECFDYILEQKLINPDIDEEETAKKFFKLI